MLPVVCAWQSGSARGFWFLARFCERLEPSIVQPLPPVCRLGVGGVDEGVKAR